VARTSERPVTRPSPGHLITRIWPGRLITRAWPGRLITRAWPGRLITRAWPGHLITRAWPGHLITRAWPGRLITPFPTRRVVRDAGVGAGTEDRAWPGRLITRIWAGHPKLLGAVSIRNLRLLGAGLAALALVLVGASSATADRSLSQNWAGYAVHGSSFEAVSARWRQPYASCTRGNVKYSAMWVGLGGYKLNSNALEQIGTELDCSGGRAVSSAWYELVPAGSHGIHLKVRPGDLVAASVVVNGSQVKLAIDNLTTQHLFQKTFNDSSIDISSAEWILEAPSACIDGTGACRTLPLTDFHHAAFSMARAIPIGGSAEPISNPAWSHTRITLGPQGVRFASNRHRAVPVGSAHPSGLLNNGSAFSITYKREYTTAGFGPRAARSGPTYLRH
jgi:hypothetical protein